MTINELKQLIAFNNKPELADKPGMVYQIWEDGEITLQKSGSLLWQRTLHSVESGKFPFTKEIMPIQEEKHGYAFIESKEIGEMLRKAMSETINL